MQIVGNEIHTLSSQILRAANFVQPLAQDVIDLKVQNVDVPSAELKIGSIIGSISIWVSSGNLIRTPDKKRRLIMEPELSEIDGYIYADNKKPVFRELRDFRLQDPAEAFKEDGKRTLNRFMEKAHIDMKQQLDIRLLSMVFWLAVDRAIQRPELARRRWLELSGPANAS